MRLQPAGAVQRCGAALAAALLFSLPGRATGQETGAGGGRATAASSTLVVGSKNFTENRILAQMMATLIERRLGPEHPDLVVDRRTNIGGTQLVFSALRSGEIDVYADYTGTGWAIILKETGRAPDKFRTFFHCDREYRARFGIRWMHPFGFNNDYKVCVRRPVAEELDLQTLSDLAERGRGLRAGFSNEFMNREDGWPSLREEYDLELAEVRGMEHGLVYSAVGNAEIDVMEAYSTDGKLLEYDVVQLVDDKGFFPEYMAAPIVRMDALERFPGLELVLNELAFRLPDDVMQALNYEVEEKNRGFREVAESFLVEQGLLDADAAVRRRIRGTTLFGVFATRWRFLLALAGQHLFLTFVAVVLAAVVAIPLGIRAATAPGLGRVVLGVAGVIQTIPSLAMLAFMIPIPQLGLGVQSAIAALALYALLPILRNTATGIAEVDKDLIDAARGIGLTSRQILLRVQMPLAVPTIMAGLRTATVISIGVATLAAFIGAGGLGEPIVTGLQLDDTSLILAGALPAALLALMADFVLALVEKQVTPKL